MREAEAHIVKELSWNSHSLCPQETTSSLSYGSPNSIDLCLLAILNIYNARWLSVEWKG